MSEPIVKDFYDACMESDEVHVNFWYPRNVGVGTKEVHVGLYDVRAADDIVIRYDFDRDGYAITREVTREQPGYMEPTGEIREVAFIPAWTEVTE